MKKNRTGNFEFSMPIILGAAGVLTIMICAFALFSKEEPTNQQPDQQQTQKWEERLNQLESMIRETDNGLKTLTTQIPAPPAAPGPGGEQPEEFKTIPETIASIEKRLEYMETRLGNLEKKIAGSQPSPASSSSSTPIKTSDSPRTVKRKQVEKAKAASPDATATSQRHHVVHTGDTLFGIAQRYQVSVDKIRQWNGLKSDALEVGQRLVVKP